MSNVERVELNGVLTMFCTTLMAWHRACGDRRLALTARVLRDVYGMEFHLAGGGCPWRTPDVDRRWAVEGMRELGMDPARFDANTLECADALDNATASGPPITDRERWLVVEQLHNALRRITGNPSRESMRRNLERLIPLIARAVRDDRENNVVDLRPILELCRKDGMA